jgi:hypothetical protein
LALIETLSKTDEDVLDLGYSEFYSFAIPSTLTPSAQLTNLKYSTNTKHTSTRGMDSDVSNVLLCSLIDQCPFATFKATVNNIEISPHKVELKRNKKPFSNP